MRTGLVLGCMLVAFPASGCGGSSPASSTDGGAGVEASTTPLGNVSMSGAVR